MPHIYVEVVVGFGRTWRDSLRRCDVICLESMLEIQRVCEALSISFASYEALLGIVGH